MDAFAAGYEMATMCDGIVNPNRVCRSYYLGWISGAHDEGLIPPDADVEAVRADMVLNLGVSEWCH